MPVYAQEGLTISEEDFRQTLAIVKLRAEHLFAEITGQHKTLDEIIEANRRLIRLSTHPTPGVNYLEEVNKAYMTEDKCGALAMYFMALSGFSGDAATLDGVVESRLRGLIRGAENLGIAYGVWYANDFIKISRSEEARNKASAKHASHTEPDKAVVRGWWQQWQSQPSLYKNKAAFDEAMSDKTGKKIRTIEKWRIELQKE